MILFKSALADLVRAGRKTQTVRLWRRPVCRPRSVHGISGGGYVHVLEVRETALDALSEADAVADGFRDVEALRRALRAIYGPAVDLLRPGEILPDGRRPYLVRFRYLGLVRPAVGRGLFD